jgi:2-(1,2-epoxy-1,2-dihydrophenyl)acetyl-CoA isomerase
MNASSTVGLRIDGSIAIATLDRPRSLNAISLELVRDLHIALDRMLETRPTPRCLVLTGAGRAFCAGGDITAHRDRPPDQPPYDLGKVLNELFNPLLLRLLRLPVPTVTAVNGAAAGAGCPLALVADFAIASRSAFFECGFAQIGLMPDLGATWLLPRLIGRARAHAMMMLDQRVSAAQAEAWGMIHRCVDDESLLETALELARRLAAGPSAALCAVRRAVLLGAASSLPDALEHEAEIERKLGFSDDFAEGIAAFFAKRPPRFGDR